MDLFEFDAVRLPEAHEDYEWLPFAERDDRDDEHADRLRAAVTGLPARPGVRR